MKLLFDQNLPPSLARDLKTLFPGSVHVRDAGLRDADDGVIWDYAKRKGFAIVSKDSDFQHRSLLYGHPPKFIWLRVGNCPAKDIEELLRKNAAVINAFGKDSKRAHLMLP